jgi:hypothetical protein
MLRMLDRGKMYWRFALGLRGFLREPLSIETSHRMLKDNLEHRTRNLLFTVKSAVYENDQSPYLKLLRFAGCEYGDFERLILSEGIENGLKGLCQAGVYISLDEFKGTREVVRGSESFAVKESDFDNALRPAVMADRSGGSRSAGTRTAYDFDTLTTYAMHRAIMLDAAGALDIPISLWWPILPGGGPKQLLMYTKAGGTVAKWFAQVSKKGTGTKLSDRVMTNYLVYAGRLCGTRWPGPEFCPLDEASTVAAWLSGEIRKGGACHMVTYPSSAVRVCQAAKERGLDIKGARFTLGGEPLTETKKAEIESAGATASSIYATMETSMLGAGCLDQAVAGDVHLLSGSFALIQRRRDVPHSNVPVDAFLVTSLLPSGPKVMLNTENGDYGVIETRSCGCKLDELGLTTHVNDIRGFDKLTAEGMTLIGTDLIRIIEEVLPARYGGSSTDYQVVEEEDEKGQTRMSILVSPSVGTIDEGELIKTVLAGLPGPGLTSAMWSHAGTFRVKRIRPEATARGKLLPLHILKRKPG